MKEREFDGILDECLERILTRGEAVEQCLADYPEHAAGLEPLLRTALFTRETLAIKPRPEFRDRARYQLRVALQEMAEKKERRFSLFSWQPRWATAVAAVLIFLVASSSTVAAASNSMPDETLYPVKLATEKVHLALTPSALGKAELYVKLADRRVAEIIKMADEGKAEEVKRVAQRLDSQLMAMTSLVGSVEEEAEVFIAPPPAATSEAPVPSVAEVAPDEESAVMMAPPPAAVQEAPAAVPVEPREVERKPGATLAPVPPAVTKEAPAPKTVRGPSGKEPAVSVAPMPTPEKVPALQPAPMPVPERAPAIQPLPSPKPAEADVTEIEKLDRRARLRVIVAHRLVEHPEALRAVLQKVPLAARPALLRVIATSDNEYKKALEALQQENNNRRENNNER